MATTAQASIPVTPVTLARPKQAAEHFQVTTMTLYRWSKQPGFPRPLKRGQVVLYNVAAIEVWLAGEAA